MSLWGWFQKLLGAPDSAAMLGPSSQSISAPFPSLADPAAVNPATGLAMVDGIRGVDTEGNAFGLDSLRFHRTHCAGGLLDPAGDLDVNHDQTFGHGGMSSGMSGSMFDGLS